jgi:hypothetical protein
MLKKQQAILHNLELKRIRKQNALNYKLYLEGICPNCSAKVGTPNIIRIQNNFTCNNCN